jgi:hypothetical protein
MNLKIRILKPLLSGAVKTARDPVNPHGCAKLVGFVEK